MKIVNVGPRNSNSLDSTSELLFSRLEQLIEHLSKAAETFHTLYNLYLKTVEELDPFHAPLVLDCNSEHQNILGIYPSQD